MKKKVKTDEVSAATSVPEVQVVVKGDKAVQEEIPAVAAAPITPVVSAAPVEYQKVVSVMFRMGTNGKTKTPQLKGSLYDYDEVTGENRYVVVTPSIDSAEQPKDGEVWICEINTEKPITKWFHKGTGKNEGEETLSILVAGIPMCKIEIPEEIRFCDVSRRGDPQFLVRDELPDGKSRVLFVPDWNGNKPVRGELWKVKASRLIHSIGVDDDPTVTIVVSCLSKVVQKASSQAWANAGGVWKPAVKK